MLIKNALITDDEQMLVADVLIKNGKIEKVATEIISDAAKDVIDADGLVLMPAFVDLHCHFRDPGFTHKEDLQTGCAAAAKGGYTFVNLMANTNPVCSSAEFANQINQKACDIGLCDVHQVVSITKDFDGKTINHLENLPPFIKAVSDDGKGVTDNDIMARAIKLSAEKDFFIMSHAEDMTISKYDYRLAENIETARNILLAQYYNARLHMSHVSTIESMQYIEAAKKQGVKVTCEVAPHHLYFWDTDYRVNPPIRQKDDVKALISAIKRGMVDCIATDHAPHTEQDKQNGAPGMIGLQTAFAACYKVLCVENGVPLARLSAMLSANPAKIMGLNKGKIKAGYDADFVLVDTDKKWTVCKSDIVSKSTNTAFEGETLQGKVVLTVKCGKITYKEMA